MRKKVYLFAQKYTKIIILYFSVFFQVTVAKVNKKDYIYNIGFLEGSDINVSVL